MQAKYAVPATSFRFSEHMLQCLTTDANESNGPARFTANNSEGSESEFFSADRELELNE